MVNDKVHMNIGITGNGRLNLYKDQDIGIVDLTSSGYYNITRNSVLR